MKSDKDKLLDVTTTLEKRIVSCETDVGFKHVYDWILILSLLCFNFFIYHFIIKNYI